MKPFPVLVSIIFLLSGFLIFFMGGWLFLVGLLASLPNLSVILLLWGGCLMTAQGALHWGRLGQLPDIILPQSEGCTDRQRFWLGTGALLWSWLSLCFGLIGTKSVGYGCEIIGFGTIFAIERYWRSRGVIPVNYYLVKTGFTFLACAGLLFAMIAPHNSY